MTRAIPLMPADVRARFLALIRPEALASFAALLAVWAASHLVGIGEGVDLALIGIGILALGNEALHVVEQFATFVRTASSAGNDEQLNRAAQYFADTVARVGVDVVVILAAYRLSTLGRATSRTSAVATEISVTIGRLQSLLEDGDGILTRLAFQAQAREDSLELLSQLKTLEKEISNFQGRPILRITGEGEWWQRASDTMAESGQDEPLREPRTPRKLTAYDQGGYLGRKFSRSGSAVFRGWNQATVIEEQLVPKGSIVLEGKAAQQFPSGASARGGTALPGGDSQIFHWGQLGGDDGFVERPVRAIGRAWRLDGTPLYDH